MADDKAFVGSVPKIYETHLVPLIFEPYAADMKARVSRLNAMRILELAAGTGVVTRAIAGAVKPGCTIVASDLNQAMLDELAAIGTTPKVELRQADAMALPFKDEEFDLVLCQFGVMFFPDKPKAFAEARRVLKPGGTFIFNAWDGTSENEIAGVVESTLAGLFPSNPPGFLSRTPYGYHDRATIEGHLRSGGFTTQATFETVAARSRAASAAGPAIGYTQGTPIRGEIEAHGPTALARATEASTEAIAGRLGAAGGVDGKIQAKVVTVVK